MSVNLAFILVFAIFCLGLAVTAFAFQTKSAQKNFILGGRNLGFIDIFSSVIAYMRTGSNLAFWFGFVAFLGFGSIWILISFYTAFIIMSLLANKAAKLSKERNFTTFPDLIAERQGRIMSILVSSFSFYVITIMTISQLFIAGSVVGELTTIGNFLGTTVCAGLVALYIFFGGFQSVVKTDIFQAIVIVLIALSAYLFLPLPEMTEFTTEITNVNWGYIIGFGLIGFAVPASTDMWQRFFAVKDEKTLRPAIFTALAVDILIVIGLIIFIKLVLSMTNADGNTDLFSGLFTSVNQFPIATALFGLFIVSALLSTIDNQIFNMASITAKNILKIDTETNDKVFIKTLRVTSILSLAIFVMLSLMVTNFMQWIVDTYAFVGVITPFIFYGVITKAYSEKLLVLGTLIASAIYWILYSQGYFENMSWYAVPFFTPILFIACDFALKKVKIQKT